MRLLGEIVIGFKLEIVQQFIGERGQISVVSLIFYVIFQLAFVLMAACLTFNFAPQTRCGSLFNFVVMMNGTNFPQYLSERSLIVRIFGSIFAVAGGLLCDRTESLFHLAQIIGVSVLYLPITKLQFLQNEFTKRQFMLVSASAVIGCWLNAPIGGVLFIFEITSNEDIWDKQTFTYAFICSITSTLTTQILQLILFNKPIDQSVMFDSKNLKDNRSTLINYSSALFLGVVGGIFAVLWLQINDLMQALRMRFITKAVVIYAEAALFSLITSISLYFLATLLYQDCVPKLQDQSKFSMIYCNTDQYNPQASLVFNTDLGTYQQLFYQLQNIKSQQGQINFNVLKSLCTTVSMWTVLSSANFGLCVPNGFIMPCIIIGGCLGTIYNFLLVAGLNLHAVPGLPTLIVGSATMFAGVTGCTFSTVVILLELTRDSNFVLPLLIAVFIANSTARLFKSNIFDCMIYNTKLPYLFAQIPIWQKNTTVQQMIDLDERILNFKDLRPVCKVQDLKEALDSQQSIVVVGKHITVHGILPKNFGQVLIENLRWYEPFQQDEAQNKKKEKINEFSPETQSPLPWQLFTPYIDSNSRDFSHNQQIAQENGSELVDLRPYLIPNPPTVGIDSTLEHVVHVLHQKYLTNIPVIDKNRCVGVIRREHVIPYYNF